jgi:hypothetical protein
MTDTTNDLTTTIDTYLEAYGEPDDARRAELVAAVWAEDGTLVDPPLDGSGHDGIAGMGAALQGLYPGHTFRRTSGIDAHHGVARYGWELVDPNGAAVLAGVDVARVDGRGKLANVTGFFGDLPAKDG